MRWPLVVVAMTVVVTACANRSDRETLAPVVPTSLVPNAPGDVGTGRCTFTIGSGLGALIVDVLPEGPAVDRLTINDVVTAFGGEEIRTAADLVAAVRARTVGDTVMLEGTRDGQPHEVEVTLTESPEVTGRPMLGVLVGTHEERREPEDLTPESIAAPLSRIVAIDGSLWVLDPTAIAWSPLEVATPEGALIAAGGEVYTVEVSGPGAAILVGTLSGEAITIDLAEWSAVSIMGSLGSLALLGAERYDPDGAILEYGIIAVDPLAGAARWVWITELASANPVPLAGYRSIDGDTVLVALGPPDATTAGLWVLLQEESGEPVSDVARGIPEGAQMVGWHDTDHVIAVTGAVDAPTVIDPVTGDTTETTLPVSSPTVRMWAVGDGTHVLVEDGEGLVLAAVGSSERRLLTASCGPAFVSEVGWVLG